MTDQVMQVACDAGAFALSGRFGQQVLCRDEFTVEEFRLVPGNCRLFRTARGQECEQVERAVEDVPRSPPAPLPRRSA